MNKYNIVFEASKIDPESTRVSFQIGSTQIDLAWNPKSPTAQDEMAYLMDNLTDIVYTATLQLEEEYEQQKENLSTPAE